MQNYQQIPTKAKCPVCTCNDAHRLWDVTSKQAAQHYVLQEKQPERYLELVSHIEDLWKQDSCEVVKCDQCEFCYSNPYVAGDKRFYYLAYERPGYPSWKWEFQITHDILSDIFKTNFKMLEIGAGDGSFVERVVDKLTPKDNIFCTEFSETGRDKISKLGVNCSSEHVRNLSNQDLKESLDAICMFQVLEHMDEIDLLFQKLNWLLKKNGSLFISVPNASRVVFNELNGALLDMPPNHIGRWNKVCFEYIGKRYGFEIKNHKVEPSSFLAMVKQFVSYRFLKRSQQSGSFENYVQSIKNKNFLRIGQVVGVALNFMMAIPAFIKKDFQQGDSQWVHLIKIR
ncbi:MAG: class I SAM-dependent methyltransferase [Methylococcaceae bacterium]